MVDLPQIAIYHEVNYEVKQGGHEGFEMDDDDLERDTAAVRSRCVYGD